jgi:hypothetical protein
MLEREVRETEPREKIEAVQRMQDHIEANLHRPITLETGTRLRGILLRTGAGVPRSPDVLRSTISAPTGFPKPRCGWPTGKSVCWMSPGFRVWSHEGFTRAFSAVRVPRAICAQHPPGPSFHASTGAVRPSRLAERRSRHV